MPRNLVRTVPIAAVVALVLAVGGCAAPEAVSGASSSPSPSPSASPTPEPSATFDRVDLECDDFGSAEEFTAILDTQVSPRNPLATSGGATGMIPRLAYVLAAGGAVCEWSNGVANAPVRGTPPDYRGIEVQVLPDAAETWQYFTSYYSHTGTRITHCNDVSCTLDDFANGYWTSAVVHGSADAEATLARLSQIADTVATLPASEPYVTPESDIQLSERSCIDYLSEPEVRATFGAIAPFEVLGSDGGWSLWAGALSIVGGESCSFSSTSQNVGILTMAGGSEIGRESRQVATKPSLAETITIDGSSDSAIRCDESGTSCIVDLTIGGHWLQVVVNDYSAEAASQPVRPITLELATLVAGRANAA